MNVVLMKGIHASAGAPIGFIDWFAVLIFELIPVFRTKLACAFEGLLVRNGERLDWLLLLKVV